MNKGKKGKENPFFLHSRILFGQKQAFSLQQFLFQNKKNYTFAATYKLNYE